jgi:hypothetical protein
MGTIDMVKRTVKRARFIPIRCVTLSASCGCKIDLRKMQMLFLLSQRGFYIEGSYNPHLIQKRLGHRCPVDYEQAVAF